MLEAIKKNIINIPGKTINNKIVVFESDDWGSIRIPNKQVYNDLLNKKLITLNDPFSTFDCLENDEDLDLLFNVLSKFKDINGNSPIFTGNTVVGNPDFKKIKENSFSCYYNENFIDTYKNHANCENAFNITSKAIEEKLFFPQFHAKEHLNVSQWLGLLKNNDINFKYAFDLNCFAIDYKSIDNRRANLMATYDYHSDNELNEINKSIKEGLKYFESIFKMHSRTTIAPCYVWDSKIESIFLENNVFCFQGSRFQNVPLPNTNNFKKIFHYNGDKNKNKQTYLSRNALFEPSLNQNIDWVDKCMESISIAFKWGKPAVIGTHRINFMGSLVRENRENGLKKLDKLLKAITSKWPEVQFKTSEELFDIVK